MNISMTTKFMHRLSKIITEVSASYGVDEIHAEALEDSLKEKLNEYCLELDEYYIEEYHIAVSSARNKAYDDGHSDGYAEGYDEGYDVGYEDGHDYGHSEGYASGYDDGYAV